MPKCLVLHSGVARSQCRIAIDDRDGQASFEGLTCRFEQLKTAWDGTREGPYIRHFGGAERSGSSPTFPVEVIALDENEMVMRAIPEELHRLGDELDDRHPELGALLVAKFGHALRVLYYGTIDDGDDFSSDEEETEDQGDQDDQEKEPSASVGILAISVIWSDITVWQRIGICV